MIYSAGLGQVALDRLSDNDANPNSIFTRSFLPLLEDPENSLVAVAKQTRAKVSTLASSVGGTQFPAYYDEVEGDIFLAKGASGDDADTVGEKLPDARCACAGSDACSGTGLYFRQFRPCQADRCDVTRPDRRSATARAQRNIRTARPLLPGSGIGCVFWPLRLVSAVCLGCAAQRRRASQCQANRIDRALREEAGRNLKKCPTP
jgi:hypothetical protein